MDVFLAHVFRSMLRIRHRIVLYLVLVGGEVTSTLCRTCCSKFGKRCSLYGIQEEHIPVIAARSLSVQKYRVKFSQKLEG